MLLYHGREDLKMCKEEQMVEYMVQDELNFGHIVHREKYKRRKAGIPLLSLFFRSCGRNP